MKKENKIESAKTENTKTESTQKENLKKEDNGMSKFEEVKSIVWDACNLFRGSSLDPMQYKDFILKMLFLKYISDIYEEILDKMPDFVKGKPEREKAYKEKNSKFIIPADSTFDDIFKQKDQPKKDSLGEVIDKALENLANANKSKLEGVFQGVKFNSSLLGDNPAKNRILGDLLEKFSKLDLRSFQVEIDIIGEVYMFLIERFASEGGKKAGEFFTPRQVSKLVAQLALPYKDIEDKEGYDVCDPACGSGGLLLEFAATAKEHNHTALLSGMENNSGTWAMCRMNLFLHGHSGNTIKKCDSLRSPQLLDKVGGNLQTFDIVVANPPFSLKNWGRETAENDQYNRFERGLPPNKAGDLAFISHMIKVAKPDTGRVAVITPHGILFRGASEGIIRQAFIEENLIDAIIGIPSNLFQTTSIPVAILIFDKSRKKSKDTKRTNNILFIDASNEYIDGRRQNSLSDKHLKNITETYQSRKQIDKYSRRVSLDEIKENDYNLNISRYIDTFPEEEQVDMKQTQKEIETLEDEIDRVRAELKKLMASSK